MVRPTLSPTCLLDLIQRDIRARYADPNLSPHVVARTHRISVRQLHRLFATTGSTFSQYLRATRLVGCYHGLTDPAWAKRPIAEIAFDHGFNSLPTFYRAFSKRYGQLPRSLRSQSLSHAKSRSGTRYWGSTMTAVP